MAGGRAMTFICPYCFEKLDLKSAWCRCKKCHQDSPPIIRMGKLYCGNCKTEVTQRLCKQGKAPNCKGCGKELPYGIDQSSDFTVAIVGPKAVGKTQYIAMLIRTLQTSFAREFGTSLSPATEFTTKKQKYNMQKLFIDKEVVPETDSIEASDSTDASRSVGEPYIYYLRKPKLFGGVKCITLVFYDTAGEDLKDSSSITSKISAYLGNADGIIYLADPLQFDYVRSCLDPSLYPSIKEQDITEVLNRLTRVVREHRGLKNNESIPAKLAIVLTKSDVLLQENDRSSNSKFDFEHARVPRKTGSVDIENLDKVSQEISEFIDVVTESEFNSAVSVDFPDHHYFLVSSLGQNPEKLNSSEARVMLKSQPTAFRVEDPLVWILYATKSGMVGGK